jgi:glycolate oxidase iron-sulfur subunit
MQIAGGTDLPVVHTVELLDWATGGPLPRALEEAGLTEADVSAQAAVQAAE